MAWHLFFRFFYLFPFFPRSIAAQTIFKHFKISLILLFHSEQKQKLFWVNLSQIRSRAIKAKLYQKQKRKC